MQGKPTGAKASQGSREVLAPGPGMTSDLANHTRCHCPMLLNVVDGVSWWYRSMYSTPDVLTAVYLRVRLQTPRVSARIITHVITTTMPHTAHVRRSTTCWSCSR